MADSACQDRVDGDRKESIRKLMKDLSKDSEHKMTPKESAAAGSCKLKSSAKPLLSKMRIFRTVS